MPSMRISLLALPVIRRRSVIVPPAEYPVVVLAKTQLEELLVDQVDELLGVTFT